MALNFANNNSLSAITALPASSSASLSFTSGIDRQVVKRYRNQYKHQHKEKNMPRYKLVNGERIQFTAEEETARDAEETAWSNGAFDRAMSDLRQRRNTLLSATDYFALSDNTLTTEMSTYRQALRDITNNLTTIEDVNAVVFPTKPE